MGNKSSKKAIIRSRSFSFKTRKTPTASKHCYPEYESINRRLYSFRDWPKALKHRPDSLSDAGFFYTGKSDRLICYSCGMGLRNLEEEDDPWEHHILWNSFCNHVRSRKTFHEISVIQDKRFSLDLPENVVDNVTTIVPSTSKEHRRSEIIDQDLEKIKNKLFDGSSDRLGNKCKICLSDEFSMLLFPCRHISMCEMCSDRVPFCPICQQTYSEKRRIYFA